MSNITWQKDGRRIIADGNSSLAQVRNGSRWRKANDRETSEIYKLAFEERQQVGPSKKSPLQVKQALGEAQHLLDALFSQHPWHGVNPGDECPRIVNSFIEIVPTDTVKYELDKRSGHLRVDRPHRSSNVCPSLYGFIPQTYCGSKIAELCSLRTGKGKMKGDGDPLDICVLTEKDVSHGNIFVRAIPIGGLRMIDGNEADDKIIAVLENDVAYGGYQDIDDCPAGLIDRLEHYFRTYKQLPGEKKRRVQIAATYNRKEAHEVIRRSIQDYRTDFASPEQRLLALRTILGY